MEFATQVVSYMVDLICEKISNDKNISQEEIVKYYFNENGKNLDELDFLKKFYFLINDNMLYELWSILVDYQSIYDDKIDFFSSVIDNDEQFAWDFALPFMATYKILADYATSKQKDTMNYFKNVSSKRFKKDFLDNDDFGKNLLRSFLEIICNDRQIIKKEKMISNKPNDYEVLMSWRYRLYAKVSSINDILRSTYYELYTYYLNQGYETSNVPSQIWAYFKNDFDPIKRLEKNGFNEKDIELCKRIMIKLMIADLFEDSNNNEYDKEWFSLSDFGDSIDEEKLLSMMRSYHKASYYLDLGTSNNYYERVISNKFQAEALFYNYYEILNNPDRMASNRAKTFDDEREFELVKINPNYKFDEF